MNVQFLCDELKKPHYCRYHIVWNNLIQDKNKPMINEIARADEYGLVASMKESWILNLESWILNIEYWILLVASMKESTTVLTLTWLSTQ